MLQGAADYRLKTAKAVFERELIQDALDATGGSRVRAAEMLSISRNVLYQKWRNTT